MASLNQEIISRIPLRLPPLPVQNRIASILSAYDDLIENNTRRIAILEEMARRLYGEWFVHFRFPGHEGVVVGEKLPEGWREAKLSDVFQIVRESTRAGEHLQDRKYVPIDCIPRRSLSLQEYRPWNEAQSSLILFEKGDLLFGAMRPYFHKVVEAPFAGVTRTTCFVLRPVTEWGRSFGVLTASSERTVDYASAHTQGATIPYAVWDGALANMPIILPDDATLRHFDDLAGPLLTVISAAMFRQKNLRAQRDLLLPKLISGEIDVSEVSEPSEEVEAA